MHGSSLVPISDSILSIFFLTRGTALRQPPAVSNQAVKSAEPGIMYTGHSWESEHWTGGQSPPAIFILFAKGDWCVSEVQQKSMLARAWGGCPHIVSFWLHTDVGECWGSGKIDSTEDVDLLTDTGCSKGQNTSSSNLSKPSGHYMYHYSWHTKILHSSCGLPITFVRVSGKTSKFSLYNLNDRLL